MEAECLAMDPNPKNKQWVGRGRNRKRKSEDEVLIGGHLLYRLREREQALEVSIDQWIENKGYIYT